MKNIITLFLIVLTYYPIDCYSQQNSLQLIVKNQNNFPIYDAYLLFNLNDIENNFIISDGNDLVPYQIEQNNFANKKVGFVLNLKSNEEKTLLVRFSDEINNVEFKNRTYAELSMKQGDIFFDKKFRGSSFTNVKKIKVPLKHTDHDALFKYEGPGWESEKVGYRFYLDWRNATDIFGKKKSQLILANVGVHDTSANNDSYHNMQDWGMDIFKVGNSLGIGSIGMWHNGKVVMVSNTDSIFCEITKNGPIKSQIKTNYYGWKVDEKKFNLESKLSISAGSRLSKNEVIISNNPSNIVTGFAKFPGTQFFKNDIRGEWSYIALYGAQTLVSDSDKLGIVLFYKTEDLQELTEDDLSYVVKFNWTNSVINYYFAAAWEQEENGIKDIDEFKKYLEETIQILNNPVIVEIK